MDKDNELIEGFKNGDTGALGLLIEKYKGPLYNYILSLVKDGGAADDIFQEVFLKIVARPDVYKNTGSFKAWLFTVGRNMCMDYFRAAGNHVSLDEELDEDFTLHDVLSSGERGPLETLLNSEDGRYIDGALAILPAEQREVIVLRQTMSFKEIAATLGCPIGTVLARASRGYKKMQEHLIKEGMTEAAYAG